MRLKLVSELALRLEVLACGSYLHRCSLSSAPMMTPVGTRVGVAACDGGSDGAVDFYLHVVVVDLRARRVCGGVE